MAISSDFTCPNDHAFTAVAKLRARCPECGQMARKKFGTQSSPTKESKPLTKTISTVTSRKVDTPTDTASGSKPDLTSKVVKRFKSVTKSTPEPVSSPKPKTPVVVRQGLTRQMPKTVSKKLPPKPEPKTRGPVRKVTAKRGIAPTVTRPPKGSRERKVIQQTSEEPFWVQAKRKYFR